MAAMQAVAPTMPSTVAPTMPSKDAPLFTTGPYALYPLHVCSEEAIAKLFVKLCARGNPVLQAKPAADLYRLGVAYYKKSVGSVASIVFLKGDEPVAMTVGWDVYHGGVWKGTSGPPDSLVCHAAIGAAMFASKPHETTMPGQDLFLAFAGVARPHPGQLLLTAMMTMNCLSASAAGCTNLFGYATHAKTIEQSQSRPDEPGRCTWRVSYSDIEVTDQAVREEMCSIQPGIAECHVTSVAFSVEALRQDTSAQVQEFVEALRPGAARLFASSHKQFDEGVQMPMASL